MLKWIKRSQRLWSALVLGCFLVTLSPMTAWADGIHTSDVLTLGDSGGLLDEKAAQDLTQADIANEDKPMSPEENNPSDEAIPADDPPLLIAPETKNAGTAEEVMPETKPAETIQQTEPEKVPKEKEETEEKEEIEEEPPALSLPETLWQNVGRYYKDNPITSDYAPLEAVGRFAALGCVPEGGETLLQTAAADLASFEAKYGLAYDEQTAAFTLTDGISVPAQLSKLILDVIALGGDPANVGGRNYVHALLNVQKFTTGNAPNQFDGMIWVNGKRKEMPLNNALGLLAMRSYYGDDDWLSDENRRRAVVEALLGTSGLNKVLMKPRGVVFLNIGDTLSLANEWGLADDTNNVPLLHTFWLLIAAQSQKDILEGAQQKVLTNALGYHLDKFWTSRYTKLSTQCERLSMYILTAHAAGRELTAKNWQDLQTFALADGSFSRVEGGASQPEATALAAIALAYTQDNRLVFNHLRLADGIGQTQAENMRLAEADAQILAELTDVTDLPTVGANGSAITWQSDDPTLVTSTGAIIPLATGEPDKKVGLQAMVRLGTACAKTAKHMVTVSPVDKTFPLARNYDLLRTYYQRRGTELLAPGEAVAIWAAEGTTDGYAFAVPDYGSQTACYASNKYGVADAILDTIAAGGDPCRYLRQAPGSNQKIETDLIDECLAKQCTNGALDIGKISWQQIRTCLALEAYFGVRPWGNETAGTRLGRIGAYEYLLDEMQDFTLHGEKIPAARSLGHVSLDSSSAVSTNFDSQCGAVLLFTRLLDDETVLSDGTILGERARAEREGLLQTLQAVAQTGHLQNAREIGFYASAMTAAGKGQTVLESHILDTIRNNRLSNGTYSHGGGEKERTDSGDPAILMGMADVLKNRAALTELCFTGGDLPDAQALSQDLAMLSLPQAAISDIKLPANGIYGSIFSWQSDAPDILSASGKCSRPAVGEPDRTVHLTVTAQKGAYSRQAEFVIVVAAQETAQMADLRSDVNAVIVPLFTAKDVDLPSGGDNGSTFRWSSDAEHILSSAGEVHLPAEETLVHLSLQATLGEHQLSRTYEVLVGRAHDETDSLTKAAYAVRQELNTFRNMNSLYWAVFSAKSLVEERFADYDFQVYNVLNHRTDSHWQCTDYGAVILQLIMQGDNPYDYHGINYVQGLIDWVNDPTNAGWGGWANPIFAALALRAAAADTDAITFATNSYDNMIRYCRARIQPTAANVLYGPDMSGWAMIVLANELDKNDDGALDDPNDPLLAELQTFFDYLRTDDADHKWLKEGKYAAMFEGANGTVESGYNVTLSAGCVVSGMMALQAAGVPGADLTADEWKVTLANGEKVGVIDTLYTIFCPAEGATRYGQIAMAFGDAFYGDSIWRRCAVTEDKMARLIAQAEALDLSQYSAQTAEALRTALAEAKRQAGQKGYGQAYFALQDALNHLVERKGITISVYGDAAHGQMISHLLAPLAGQSAADAIIWAAEKMQMDCQLDASGKLLAVEDLRALDNQGWWCYQNGVRMDIPLADIRLAEGDSIVFKFDEGSKLSPEDDALTKRLLAEDAAWLAIGGAIDEKGQVTGDILLPTMAPFGSAITWQTDKVFAIDENGKVMRDKQDDITVHLQAHLSLDGQSVPKHFTVTVLRANATENSGGISGERRATLSVKGPVGSGLIFFPEAVLEIEAGETAYSLLRRTNLSIVADENSQYGVYVRAINGLSEFDEGPDSGWMYRINGQFLGYSAALARIEDGDTVEWLYTRDRGKDIGGYVPENVSSGGNSTVGGVADTVDAQGRAEINLTTEATDSLLEAIQAAGSGDTVEIVTAAPETAQSVAVNVPMSILQALGAKGSANLLVTTDLATWRLDGQALKSIAQAANGQAVELCVAKQDSHAMSVSLPKSWEEKIGGRPIFDLQITAGSRTIDTWQGTLTLCLPYTLQKGERAEDMLLLHLSDEKATAVDTAHYDKAQKGMVFDAKHFSLYAIANQSETTNDTFPFSDVPETHWAREVIAQMVQKKMLAGRTAERFAPEEAVTRAEMVALLARLDGVVLADSAKQIFADVEQAAWYTPAVNWAAEQNLVHGIDGKNFAPNAPISRQDLAVLSYNYLKSRSYAFPLAKEAADFTDRTLIGEYALESVTALQKAGIISGKINGYFDPLGTASRAEAAAILSRLMALRTK